MYASTTEPNSSESANSHGKSMRVHSEKPGVGVEPTYSCSAGSRLNRSATPAIMIIFEV